MQSWRQANQYLTKSEPQTEWAQAVSSHFYKERISLGEAAPASRRPDRLKLLSRTGVLSLPGKYLFTGKWESNSNVYTKKKNNDDKGPEGSFPPKDNDELTHKGKEIMVSMFKALIRPVLEYSNVVSNPQKKI